MITSQQHIPSDPTTDAIEGIIGLSRWIYNNIFRSLGLILLSPLIIPFFNYTVWKLRKQLRQRNAELRNWTPKTSEEYDSYKAYYLDNEKLLMVRKLRPKSRYALNSILFLNALFSLIDLWEEERIIIGEKLFLRPVGLTEEELEAATKKQLENKELQKWLAEDDDDFDYAKALALGEL